LGDINVNSDEYEFYAVVCMAVFCTALFIIMHAINHVVKVNTRQLRNDIAALRLQISLEHEAGAGHLRKQRIRALNVAQKVEARGDDLYVWAWCDRDQTLRQFRVDRISTLVHETGEISEPVDLAMWLAERQRRGTGLKE
jgi:predicted DNA-binding transcriptional regulator YafY